MKNHMKNFILGLLGFVIYFVGSSIQTVLLECLHIDYNNWPIWLTATYDIIYQILLVILIILLFYKEIKAQIIEFKNHANDYLKKYIKYWFLTLGLMYISNLIILVFFTSEIAGNEQGVRNLLNSLPIYTFIVAVIIAPWLEELVFRYSLQKMCFGVKWLFIILSGIIFGGMHVIGNAKVWTDWLFIIPYGIPGWIFAYVLTKSKNIFTSIMLHTIHNGVQVSILLLATLAGILA